MCSYFETTNILADSRNNPEPIDGYSMDSDEQYDYQDTAPAVQLLSKISATDVRNWRDEKDIIYRLMDISDFQSETIVCGKNENYCFTLWSFSGKQNVTFNKQGKYIYPEQSSLPFS